MSVTALDKTFVGAGGVLFLAACVWAFFQQSSLGDIKSTAAAPSFGEAYVATEVGASNVEITRTWPAPAHLPRGRSWVYDVFTPPDIYYDQTTQKFRAVRLDASGPSNQQPQGFGLELLEVNQTPFRLQLVGYTGLGTGARGVFQDMKTGATILGATGKEIAELNLKIVDFSAVRQRIEVPGETPRIVTVAAAKVQDTVTGREYQLSNQVKLMTDEISATVRVVSTGTVQRLAVGETLDAGDGVSYVIDKINGSPASVTATKRVADSDETFTEVLSPQQPEEGPVKTPAPTAPAGTPQPNPFLGL